MPKDGPLAIWLLGLVLLFFYIPVAASHLNEAAYTEPLNFGKVIDRLLFDSENPQSVFFVGDIMLARDVERRLDTYGVDYPFAKVKEYFSGNYLVGNFEAATPKLHQPTPDFNTRFSVKDSSLDALVKARFTHLSLANNHANDFGSQGISETIEQLELRNLSVFGSPTGLSSTTTATLMVNDEKVVLTGLNAVTSNPDLKKLQQILSTFTDASDLLVVYIHWGEEYAPVHNKQQEELAQALIDLGADLIIGHHPHVVQDIGIYKGRLIFYSLGNFVFDQYFSESVQLGLVLQVKPGGGDMTVELHPVSSLESKNQPDLMLDESKASFLESLSQKSDPNLRDAILEGRIVADY